MSADVLLLRDVPEQRLLSMERLADEMERGFAARAGFSLRSMALHQSAIARRIGLGALDSYATRFVRYPLAAARERADVYHIVDHGYAHVAAMLPKDRVVASCHDLMLLRGEEGEAGFRGRRTAVWRFRWSTSFLRRVARVIVPTEVTKQDVVRLIGVDPNRIDVAPYGVGDAFRPFGAERALSLRRALAPDGVYVALHVSTGNPYKNVEGVLRTIAALRGAGVPITLVRAGKPMSREQAALARAVGIVDAIVECGRVPEQRLVELYNACDVLLFPSHHEGYGWPPLEAMACGTPVVTSPCQALVEVTGSAALHAPANDIDALAAQVRRVVEDDDVRERLRWAGIQRAGQYTWERTIDGLASAYAQVLAASEMQRAKAVAA